MINYVILGLLCLFEIICVPAIFLSVGLNVVLVSYTIATSIMIICIAFLVKRKKIQLKKPSVVAMEVMGKKLLIVFFVSLLIQLGLVTFYASTDADDAMYMGLASSAYSTGEMYSVSPYTGEKSTITDVIMSDYVLSPLPMFWAVLGKMFSVHPTMLAHTIMPIFLIAWAYYVYWKLAWKIFGKFQESITCLVIVSVLNIFGAYSLRTTGVFLLTRIWQGKAIFCAILVPLLFYYYLCLLKEEKCALFGIYLTMGAAVLVSFSAIPLMPVLLMTMALSYAVWKRKIKIPLQMCGAAIPHVILAVIYVFVL